MCQCVGRSDVSVTMSPRLICPPLPHSVSQQAIMTVCCAACVAIVTSAVNDLLVKLYNHREDPYWGLLLVESGYYCFHIKDTIKTLC